MDSNVESNFPLYVGERISSLLVKSNRIRSGITARVPQLEKKDAEWIVAIKIPVDNGPIKDKPSGTSRRFDNNRYNYLVKKVVSREIRQGEDSPLSVPETDINT